MFADVRVQDVTPLVADLFGEELLSLKRFSQGVENANYHVQTTTKAFVLRIYLERDQDEIDYELSVLSELKDFPFVPHIASSQVTIKGKPAVFFTYIPGKLLGDMPIKDEHITTIMQHLRAIHEKLATFIPAGKKIRFAIDDLSFLDWPCDEKYAAMIEQEKTYLREKNVPTDLPLSVIHEDISPQNIIVGDDVYFIDFDDAHRAPIISDVATAIKGLIIDLEGVQFEKIHVLLKAYGTLSKEELALIYYLVKRRTMFMLLYMMQLPVSNQQRGLLIQRELNALTALQKYTEEQFTSLVQP